jgi:fructose-bisphosphate aldolase class I
MEAGPVVSGKTESQVDMDFFDKKFDYSIYKNKYAQEVIANAKKLGGTPGKGILATDESNYTIGLRFDGINVENTYENRIGYRSMLYRDPSVGEYFSGAIMFDETARATDPVSGKTTIKLLEEAGMLPGIKIDIGLKEIPGTFGEVATQGLDNITDKAKEYYEMGIRFAKWRAVIKIDEANECPTDQHIMEVAHSLARYGAACQHNGLVPIIEPEILMDGAHSIETCYKWSDKVL